MPIQGPGSPNGPKFNPTPATTPTEPQRPLIGTRSVGPAIQSKPKPNDAIESRRPAPMRNEQSGSVPSPRAPDAANRRATARPEGSTVYNSATRDWMRALLSLPEASQARLSAAIEAFA